jgi:hypothetical protein
MAALELGEVEAGALRAWDNAEKLFAARNFKDAKESYEAFTRAHGGTKTAAAKAEALKERQTAIDKVLGPATAPGVRQRTFTMSLWVKPADDTALFEETNLGITGLNDPRNNFAVLPEHGQAFAPDGSHAGCGLTVGKNGVCVFEHSSNYFVPILVHPAKLTGWTHVAVVYQENQPSLYLNGVLVHKGLKSGHEVHPTQVGLADGFRGQLGSIRIDGQALSAPEIAKLLRSK